MRLGKEFTLIIRLLHFDSKSNTSRTCETGVSGGQPRENGSPVRQVSYTTSDEESVLSSV